MISSRPVTCLTFHNIASSTVPATALLNATTTPDAFAHQLDYLQRRYRLIDLDQLQSGDIPERAALITFDDAYASIADLAAPMLAARKLPSVLFVNPGPVASRIVPLDALASLFCATHGAVALAATGSGGTFATTTFAGFLNDYVAHRRLDELAQVKARLLAALDVGENDLHASLGLFMRPAQLAALPALGMEVANHTATHVHCGPLTTAELEREIIGARDSIGDITGRAPRAFAFPWGHQRDATDAALSVIRSSGHVTAFLVHGRNNTRRPASDVWYRLMMRNETGARLALTLSGLPRLREWKAALRG